MNSPGKALLTPYSNYNIALCFIQIIDLLKKKKLEHISDLWL